MESLDSKEEGKADALLATNLATMQGSVRIEGAHHMMMITIIPGATSITMIEGMQDIKEMVDPPRKQGTLGMNQMLLTINKMNII